MEITNNEIKQQQNEYENWLIKLYTGKTIGEVLNDYSMPELMRLSAFLNFMM